MPPAALRAAAGRRHAGLAQHRHAGGRCRDAARPGAARAGDHRRHHLVGDDPDPHGRDGARQGGPGVAGLVLADADRSSGARGRPTASSSAPSRRTRSRAWRQPAMRSTRASRSSPSSAVNNDFGVNLAKEFSAAYKALGGTITSTSPTTRSSRATIPRRPPPWRASPTGSTSSRPRSTAPRSPAPGFRAAARRNSC